MNYIIKLLICLLIILVFSGCAITHKFGPFIGKVVDTQTGEPIEGAAVHLEFMTVTADVGGGHSTYAGSVECLTDKKGEFNLSYRANTFRMLSLWEHAPSINVFKPGYGAFPGYRGTKVVPKPPGWPHIEKNIYCVISLPKLTTDKERRDSQGKIRIGAGVPLEDMKIIRTLQNQERIYLGLKPGYIRNSSENKDQ